MKKPTLRISAAMLTLSMALTAGAAMAAPAAITTLPALQAPASNVSGAFAITVNGAALDETGYQPSGAKEPLLPLRAIAEALGFDIAWNNTTKAVALNKGDISATAKSGEARSSVGTTLTTLESAPQTKANKLYVPVSFIRDVLQQTISVNGNEVNISDSSQQDNIKRESSTGIITGLNSNGTYQSVQINGAGMNGMVLNLSEDTVLQMADGTKLSFDDLHIGMTVEVEHANFMTMSLPPQTPAFNITVQDESAQADMLGTDGIIEEVTKTDDGSLRILLTGTGLSETSQSQIVLRISEDTVIVNNKGEAVDSSALVKGAQTVGFYSPVMTRSLPPIGGALKLIVSEVQE